MNYRITLDNEELELDSEYKILVKHIFSWGELDINSPYYITCKKLHDDIASGLDEYFIIRNDKQKLINNIERIHE